MAEGFSLNRVGIRVVREVTLRASRADVRSGSPSEARLLMPAGTGMSRSENPRILMWGMGGAAAGFSLATAARRARAGTEPHYPDAHLRKGKGPLAVTPAGLLYPGSVLLSHCLAAAVSWALEGLTSVFGMGTGGAPPVWPPGTSLANSK